MHYDIITFEEKDLHDVHTLLGAKEAEELKLKAAAVAHFIRAKDKEAAAKEIADAFGPRVRGGLSVKTLYRLAKKFEEADDAHKLTSLIDRRLLRKLTAGGLAENREFVAYWHQLCLENKRATAPAYRELFARLRAGDRIPGFGDWRQIWAAERGSGILPDPKMACPYEAGVRMPKGWSLRNLTSIKPDAFALVAARKGTMHATMDHLPDVKRTRVGLKSCRVVQIDDMWYEHKVAFAQNKFAQRVVEFAMIDVATGKLFAYLPKPVIEKEDGTKETLRSAWTRYLIAHLLCTVGVPEEGCLIMGEHGTASGDGYLEETLARITGGKVTFGAGGLLSQPLFAGGFQGTPKGNPRYKGLLEGFHSLVKNELAAVSGHMGGGREGKSEFVYGMEKTDNQLRALATALEQERPGIRSRLQFPFMDYYDFRAIIDIAYDRINARRDHALEGWEGQGFMLPEYWDGASASWVPVDKIREMPGPIQMAYYNAIQQGTMKVRRTRLSPSEAWEVRKGDRAKVYDPVVAVQVMGMELSKTCVCDGKLSLRYKDLSTFTDVEVSGILQGGGSLTRGKSYLVWINPFDGCKAYVCDIQGRYLGVAPVREDHRYDDIEGIKRAIGVRNAALAEERRRVQPALNRMARKAAAVAASNAAEILGEDPALRVAVRSAAEHELARVEAADLTGYLERADEPAQDLGLDYGSLPDGDGPAVSSEELASLA